MINIERIVKVLESALTTDSVVKDSIILVPMNPYLPNITAGDVISAREELDAIKALSETNTTMAEHGVTKLLPFNTIGFLPAPENKVIHLNWTGCKDTVSL